MPVISIQSEADPRVAAFLNVRDAHLRSGRLPASEPCFMAEGEVVARVLFRSAYETVSVLLNPTRLLTMADAIAALPPSVPVYVAEPPVMDRIVGFHIHRGVLALGRRRPLPSPAELLRDARLVVVLEDLSNHDNLGGIFRSASAFGADAVLLSPRCADPLYRKSLRVSVGQALNVPFAVLDPWPGALEAVAGAGFRLAALTTSAPDEALDRFVRDLERSENARVAVLAGAEGPGLTSDAVRHTSVSVRIPIQPGVDSLNVSVAVAIALDRIGTALGTIPGRRGSTRIGRASEPWRPTPSADE